MEQFMLFGFNDYYPAGGMTDFIASFATVEAAKDYVLTLESTCDVYQLYDVLNAKITYIKL